MPRRYETIGDYLSDSLDLAPLEMDGGETILDAAEAAALDYGDDEDDYFDDED